MDNKPLTVAIYLCVGAALLGLMASSLLRTHSLREHRRPVWSAIALAWLATFIFLFGATPSVSASAIAGAGVSALACSVRRTPKGFRMDAAAVSMLFLAFCLAVTLAWWRRTGEVTAISWRELLLIQSGLIAATYLLTADSRSERDLRPLRYIVSLSFVLGGIVCLFSTGLFRQPWMLWLSWHHWGAYIGPAELARHGVRIFSDAPAQYGAGPTALLALSCGSNCWRAMYFVAGASSLAYAGFMISIAWITSRKGQTAPQVILIGLVTFISLFVWTAYPPSLGSPALTPSVAGLRFLPLAALLWSLTHRLERRPNGMPPEAIHVLWLAGVLWSPESAFQVSAVWWPYYVWARCVGTEKKNRLRSFVWANATLGSWLLAACIGFIGAYRLGYGIFPTADAYFAYVLYPPGPLPVRPFGIIWFFALAGTLGAIALHERLRRAPDDAQTHRIVILLLAAFGVTSYFLGRSHDNNLLNVCAFFVLLLISLRHEDHAPMVRVTTNGLLAAILVYPLLANWHNWASVTAEGNLLDFHPKQTVQAFSYMNPAGAASNQAMAGPNPPATVGSDAARGMRTIWEASHEPVTVIDPSLNLEGAAPGLPWSAYHGPENYFYLPADLRRKFLDRVARRLNAPGWVLIRKGDDAQAWLTDYDAVYRRDGTLDFGSYEAIRYAPHPAPSKVP